MRDIEAAVVLEYPYDSQANGQQGRLSVLCQGQLAFRALEHHPREMLRQRIIDFAEQFARRLEGFCKRLAHAQGLRSLSGKNKSPLHVRAHPSITTPARHSPVHVAVKKLAQISDAHHPAQLQKRRSSRSVS